MPTVRRIERKQYLIKLKKLNGNKKKLKKKMI